MNDFIVSIIYKEVLKKFPKGELEINLYWEKDMLFFRGTSKLMKNHTFQFVFSEEHLEDPNFISNLTYELLKIEKKIKSYYDQSYRMIVDLSIANTVNDYIDNRFA